MKKGLVEVKLENLQCKSGSLETKGPSPPAPRWKTAVPLHRFPPEEPLFWYPFQLARLLRGDHMSSDGLFSCSASLSWSPGTLKLELGVLEQHELAVEGASWLDVACSCPPTAAGAQAASLRCLWARLHLPLCTGLEHPSRLLLPCTTGRISMQQLPEAMPWPAALCRPPGALLSSYPAHSPGCQSCRTRMGGTRLWSMTSALVECGQHAVRLCGFLRLVHGHWGVGWVCLQVNCAFNRVARDALSTHAQPQLLPFAAAALRNLK